MPSRDVNQCCYKEGRRRCRKNGTGNPPLCNAHRLILKEQLAPDPEPTLADVVADFLNGGKINLEEAVQAATGWVFGGRIPTDSRRPPPTDPRIRATAGAWANMSPDEILNDIRGHQNRPPPPPAPDPREQQRKAAKVVLGFAPNDDLDEARIRRRHRELAMRHHPDRGGSVAKMAKINDAVDVLLG